MQNLLLQTKLNPVLFFMSCGGRQLALIKTKVDLIILL